MKALRLAPLLLIAACRVTDPVEPIARGPVGAYVLCQINGVRLPMMIDSINVPPYQRTIEILADTLRLSADSSFTLHSWWRTTTNGVTVIARADTNTYPPVPKGYWRMQGDSIRLRAPDQYEWYRGVLTPSAFRLDLRMNGGALFVYRRAGAGCV